MADRYVDPFPRYLTASIKPDAGGQLTFFEPGSTTTKKPVFKDQQGLKPHTNPVILDASGVVPDIFLDGTYGIEKRDKNGVLTDSADPIGGDATGGAFADWNETVSYSINDLVTGSDGCRYNSLVDNNLNNDPASEANPASWEKILFIRIWNANVTYALNDAVRGSDGEDYQSITAVNLNNNPTTDNRVNWRLQTLTPVVTAAAKLFAFRNF